MRSYQTINSDILMGRYHGRGNLSIGVCLIYHLVELNER